MKTQPKQKHYGGSLAISEDELSLIINTIMKRRPKRKSRYYYFCNIRNSMMVIMGWFLSLRSKNYVEAELQEINLNKRTLYIPPTKSKSGEQEVMIIPRCLIPRLQKYLKVRSKLFPNSRWLFPAVGKKCNDVHIDLNTYYRMLRECVKKCGLYQVKYIDKQGHKRGARTSHGLRKGGATKVWMITGNVEKVAIHLSHTDPRRRSTFTYIQAAKEQVRNQICDEVFDEVWRDEGRVQSQTEMLIKLLKLSQNRHVPILKI